MPTFVDVTPNKPKLHNAIEELKKNDDLEIIDYHYRDKTNHRDY